MNIHSKVNIKNFKDSNKKKPLIDVLNKEGLRTGETLPREEIHRLGKIHRAVHLYLFDVKGNILLQKRSDKVDHYPGMFSISLTGHVDAGESSSDTLYREIEEELNLDPKQMNPHFLFSYRRDAVLNPTYIDRQFNDVYTCFYDFELNAILFDTQDITEVQLIPFPQFQTMVKDKNTLLSKIYGKAYIDLIYFLKTNSKGRDILKFEESSD